MAGAIRRRATMRSPQFQALRPVILTGWEMPLLLKAIVQERPADGDRP